jgi:16S rRNA G527 N7-methylase RsmG
VTLGLFDPADVPDVRAEWAAMEAHFLPLAVAQQGVEACRDNLFLVEPEWIIDVGAGSGSIGVGLRAVFPNAHIVAVEPREDEVPHLLRHYDEVFVGTIEDFAKLQPRPRYDLAISNPRWSLWGDIFEATLPIVKHRGFVVMHGPSSWGHSDETSEHVRVFDEHQPVEQWRVRGRVAYNGDCATDNRKVSWWAWRKRDPNDEDEARREKQRHGWRCITLPALDGELRRWRVRPGTEGTL